MTEEKNEKIELWNIKINRILCPYRNQYMSRMVCTFPYYGVIQSERFVVLPNCNKDNCPLKSK